LGVLLDPDEIANRVGPSRRVCAGSAATTMKASVADKHRLAPATLLTESSMLRIRARHLPRVAGLVLGLVLFAGAAPSRTEAAMPFQMDLYFTSGYERQVDNRTCVAASTAMMLNFIARKDLRLNQLAILRYAQPRDALNDKIQRGSDPLGWSRALTNFDYRTGVDFIYKWETFSTETAALERAATQMAITRKPVGLVIAHGGHAVVMTGFEASRDPRSGDFALSYVWVSDPYGSKHKRYTAAGSPLDDYRALDATPTYDRAWYRKFVIIVPQAPPAPVPVGSAIPTR
jgi:hypothetical protein